MPGVMNAQEWPGLKAYGDRMRAAADAAKPTPREIAAANLLQSGGFKSNYVAAAIRERIDNHLKSCSFDVYGLYEMLQDRIAIELPDITKAYEEYNTVGGTIRLVPEMFRPRRAVTYESTDEAFSTPEEAENALTKALEGYFRDAISRRGGPNERLLICWRLRPEVERFRDHNGIETAHWTARARVATLWVDKTCVPTARDIGVANLLDVAGIQEFATQQMFKVTGIKDIDRKPMRPGEFKPMQTIKNADFEAVRSEATLSVGGYALTFPAGFVPHEVTLLQHADGRPRMVFVVAGDGRHAIPGSYWAAQAPRYGEGAWCHLKPASDEQCEAYFDWRKASQSNNKRDAVNAEFARAAAQHEHKRGLMLSDALDRSRDLTALDDLHRTPPAAMMIPGSPNHAPKRKTVFGSG